MMLSVSKQFFLSIVTICIPESANEAGMIVGLDNIEIKLLGPFQKYTVESDDVVALRLMIPPSHIG